MGKIVDSMRPVPVPNDRTRGFWDAAKEGQLAIQRCQVCKRYYHPPVPQCYRCESRDLRFEAVSGRGKIYTFTWLHDSRMPAFAPAGAYAIVDVELDEQPWLLVTGNMDDCDPSEITIGAPVQAVFVQAGEDMVLPDFTIIRS